MRLNEELQMSEATTHEQVSCSFCGKSQNEERCLIEGGCRNPASSRCVFICDECITFSAQVIAGNDANAKDVQRSAKLSP
jgi:ATP-dependent protease Clp ATPase subunit